MAKPEFEGSLHCLSSQSTGMVLTWSWGAWSERRQPTVMNPFFTLDG